MSQQLISRSPDLLQLCNEGYNIQVKSGCLLVKDVPYVNAQKEVKLGTLVSKLTLAGDVTVKPDDHVAYFIGEHPCNSHGVEIPQIKHSSTRSTLADGVEVDHMFSARPMPSGNYDNYYHKMTNYVGILSGPAQEIKPGVTTRTFRVIEPEEEESVFNYRDTASTRAEITSVTKKLELDKLAIIGLGGTGSYVLDYVAKTPVKQIHLYDGDRFLQHNAFRSPGAPSVEELQAQLPKASYFKAIYSKMHRGIIAHDTFVTEDNIDELKEMRFVFLCMDGGSVKKLIIEKLEQFSIPFIDVGMGLFMTDDTSLSGMLATTTSTKAYRESRKRISFFDGDGKNEYDRNIQIADLNALNAALAVVKWKKLFGFYHNAENEYSSVYTIESNMLINDDRQCHE
jgi:hypothetical protein